MPEVIPVLFFDKWIECLEGVYFAEVIPKECKTFKPTHLKLWADSSRLGLRT